MWTLFLLVVTYIIGSIPSGLWIAQALEGKDLSKQGSGNTGAANAFRQGGWKVGLLTLLADITKGLLAFGLSQLVLIPDLVHPIVESIFGLTVVLGHDFSIFRGFKGGKGVATTLGFTLGLSPVAGFLAIMFWFVGAGFTLYSSVGSLCLLTSIPFLLLWKTGSVIYTVWGILVAALGWYQHRENLERLRAGEENYLVGE